MSAPARTGSDSSGVGAPPGTMPRARSLARAGSEAGAPRALWLDAWCDPVAGAATLCGCVATCNLFGDGDWRLVVADVAEKKLKARACAPVAAGSPRRSPPRAWRARRRPHAPHPGQVWKGTQRASEHALLDTPVALVAFVPDVAPPRAAALAVAAGPHVFIFKALRPFFKFALPPLPAGAEEAGVWCGGAQGARAHGCRGRRRMQPAAAHIAGGGRVATRAAAAPAQAAAGRGRARASRGRRGARGAARGRRAAVGPRRGAARGAARARRGRGGGVRR